MKISNLYLLFNISIFILISGCSTTKKNSNKNTPNPNLIPEKSIPQNTSGENNFFQKESIDLSLLKMKNRIEELETKYLNLHEKYKVLEKGLTLGLIPKEMNLEFLEKNSKKISFSKKPKKNSIEKIVSKTKKEEKSPDFQSKLKIALKKYHDGKYGQALVDFQKLETSFKENQLQGNHLYWIGLCWLHLKEYLKSTEYLSRFIDQYPNNSLVRKATFFKAKSDLNRGLPKIAVSTFEALIRQNPEDEVSELSDRELKAIEKEM